MGFKISKTGLIWAGVVILGMMGAGVGGFHAGRLYEILDQEGHRERADARTKGLARRTEHYTPPCEDLARQGLPRVVQEGEDYFLVLPKDNTVYVMGINLEKAPLTWWWGADLSTELTRCRGDKP